jgi:HEAT repeat protein
MPSGNRVARAAVGAAVGIAAGSALVFAIVFSSFPSGQTSFTAGLPVIAIIAAYGFIFGCLSRPQSRQAILLAHALRTKDPTVQSQAAIALKGMGPAASSAVPALTAALEDQREMVRQFAAEALGGIGRSAIEATPALIKCLTDYAPLVTNAAECALRTFGPTAVSDAVTVAMKTMDPYDRKTAAERLELLGVKVELKLPAVVSALDQWRNGQPIDPLSGFAPEKFVSVVTGYRNAWLRSKAIFVLGQMGPRSSVAVPALIKVIRCENYTWRDQFIVDAAIEALAKIDPSAAVPELVAVVDQSERRVLESDAALRALGALGPAALSAVPALQARMQVAKGGLDHLIAFALWQIGVRSPEVIAHLAAALRREHDRFGGPCGIMHRLQACDAVEFLPNIIDRLDDKCGTVVAAAAETLGNFGEPAKAAIPRLRSIATGSTHFARLQSALALHKIDPSTNIAIPALIEMLAGPREIFETFDDDDRLTWRECPTSEYEQAQAARALGSIGSAAELALPALRTAAQSNHDRLKTAALEAIDKIESAKSRL